MADTTFAGITVPPDLSRRHFLFLYFNTLMIGIVMVMPAVLQPAFLKDVIGVSPAYFGSINSLLSIISQIATLALAGFIGVLSDRIGRKPLAVFGFAFPVVFFVLYYNAVPIADVLRIPEGLSAALCALLSFVPHRAEDFSGYAPALLTVYFMRLMLGVGFVMVMQQFVIMAADYSTVQDRGKAMAMNGMMIGIASAVVFGLAAPLVRQYGVELMFYASAGLALVGMLCTAVCLRDRVRARAASTVRLRDIIAVVRRSPSLKAGYLCALVTRADMVVVSTFVMAWGVMLAGEHGLSSAQATARMALPMVVMTLGSFLAFPLTGVLLDRWGRLPTIIVSLLMCGCGMLLLAVCPSPFSGLVYVAMVMIALGVPGAIAGSNTLTADAAPRDMVGSIMGGLTTMQPIGIIFFLVISGYLFDAFAAGWVFGLKGAATLSLGVLMYRLRRRISG